MPSKPDRISSDIAALTSKTEDFIGDILRDASARGFCRACALNFVARLIVAACAAVTHEEDASTDELPPTDFDDAPGHA